MNPLSQLIYSTHTTQKIKFSIKDFFSKCDQIRRKLRIWSHLLKKSLIEDSIFVQCHSPLQQCCSEHLRLFSFVILKHPINSFWYNSRNKDDIHIILETLTKDVNTRFTSLGLSIFIVNYFYVAINCLTH